MEMSNHMAHASTAVEEDRLGGGIGSTSSEVSRRNSKAVRLRFSDTYIDGHVGVIDLPFPNRLSQISAPQRCICLKYTHWAVHICTWNASELHLFVIFGTVRCIEKYPNVFKGCSSATGTRRRLNVSFATAGVSVVKACTKHDGECIDDNLSAYV